MLPIREQNITWGDSTDVEVGGLENRLVELQTFPQAAACPRREWWVRRRGSGWSGGCGWHVDFLVADLAGPGLGGLVCFLVAI